MSMDEYPHWKLRFEKYLNGVDTNLWLRIESEYIRPRNENNQEIIVVERMVDDHRKIYDLEKRHMRCYLRPYQEKFYTSFRRVQLLTSYGML